jgi:hypothetical protein
VSAEKLMPSGIQIFMPSDSRTVWLLLSSGSPPSTRATGILHQPLPMVARTRCPVLPMDSIILRALSLTERTSVFTERSSSN